jgi:hypothetical protein
MSERNFAICVLLLLKGTVMLNHMTEVKVAVFVANTV